MRVLVVTGDVAEREAVAAGLHGPAQVRRHSHGSVLTVATTAGIIDVVAGGIGPVATASTTGWLLGSADREGSVYAAVIVIGSAAAYPGRGAPGEVIVADRVVDADLGVETETGSRPPSALGLDATITWDLVSPPPAAIAARVAAGGFPVRTGTILTTTRITTTAGRVAELVRLHGPAAEASTGAGGLVATLGSAEVGFGEIRVIERIVGSEPSPNHSTETMALLAATAEAVFDQPLPR